MDLPYEHRSRQDRERFVVAVEAAVAERTHTYRVPGSVVPEDD